MRKVLFLFGQLNDDDVEWMLTTGAKRFVPAEGVLIQQGAPVDAIFILLEGTLAVWLKSRRGPERELARLSAGEIVGEMSFVDARPPSATVKAREDSTVFALSKAALNRKGGSWVGSLLIGVVGALVGGFLGSIAFDRGIGSFWSPWTWLLAFVGSVIVLAVWGAISGRSPKR